jgi:hypothetical protein
MDSGIYVTFYNEGDPAAPQRARIGPYDDVVIRGPRAVGGRAGVGQIVAARGSNGEWMGALAGQQSGGDTRTHINVIAEGAELLVRFFDEETTEGTRASDFGPFRSVAVGVHDIRTDGNVLAVRVSRTAPWLLTDNAGKLEGTAKAAIAFVTGAAVAHVATTARVAQPAPNAPSAKAPVEERAPGVWVDRVKPEREIYVSRPDTPPRR